MAFTSQIKRFANRVLEPFNIKIETRIADNVERSRLVHLDRQGHFERPILPVLAQFSQFDPAPLLRAVKDYKDRTSRFSKVRSLDEYSYDNDYFSSSDAEIAYA